MTISNNTPYENQMGISSDGPYENQVLTPNRKSSPMQSPNQELDPHDAEAHGVKPYTRFVACAMVFNYIVGTGCFGLPKAFTQTGLVLTSFLLLGAGGLVALLSLNYTLETMARADGVANVKKGETPVNAITYRKYDFSAIGRIFGGAKGQAITQASIALYSLGTLWAYGSVFSSSIASIVFTYGYKTNCDPASSGASTGCVTSYYLAMCVFAVIVLSLVVMNLGEQAAVQTFLTVYRVFAFALMLITLMIKVASDESVDITRRVKNIGSFNWRNFGYGFGPCLLAVTCAYNIPDAIQPLKTKEHARMSSGIALIVSCVLMYILGILGALAFDNVEDLISLNWKNYTGCGGGWSEECSTRSWYAVIVQLLVLCFPVLNVTSVFPMIGVTLGENLLLSFPKEKITERSRKGIRLAVSIPPLLLAAVFKKLNFVFSISGIFGFILSLTLPFLYEALSLRYFDKIIGNLQAARTPYDTPFSNFKLAAALVFISLATTVYAISTLFTS